MYVIFTDSLSIAKSARANGDQIVTISSGYAHPITKSKTEEKPLTIKDAEIIASRLIQSLGIPAHIKGYDYIKFILLNSLKEPGFEKKPLTTIIYPKCAKKFNTTSTRVERAIRHAVQSTFEANHLSSEYIDVLGKPNSYPTNHHFLISLIVYFKNNFI